MDIVGTIITTQYKSTRKGGTCEPQRHEDFVELYAPALQPNDWYLIKVKGYTKTGTEIVLATVVVKR